MQKVIQINNISKVYDLGLVGTGTFSKDLNRTWAKIFGKPDPYATLAELNDRTKASTSGIVKALYDINFSVEQGEVLGIIGKNGAGKSTLLKILSQITSPTTGEIKIKGRVASLLEVGTGMHPEMTARQNVYLNGSLMGMRRYEITRKLNEIVDFAGIKKYIDTPTKRFSSGMLVRLGFAVAAFLEPEILIVDEVLAVGDAEFQQKAIGKMKDVSATEGRTVLFVSHNMAAVKSLCTKAIVLEKGTIDYSGDVTSSIAKYLNNNKSKSSFKKNITKKDDNIRIDVLKFDVEPLTGEIINISSGFQFNLVFENKIVGSNLDVTFELISELELTVFHHGTIVTKDKDSKPGSYQISGQVPGELINAGLYSFNLIFGENQRIEILRIENIIDFEITNESFIRNSDILPGIIRPNIKYENKFLGK